MSDTGPSAKDKAPQDQVPPSTAGNPDDLIPVVEYPDELDEAGIEKLLAEEAPEFTASLSEIASDKSLEAKEISISNEEQALSEEIILWQQSHGFKKFLYRVIPGVPRISLKLKIWKFQLFFFVRAQWVRFKNFLYFLATDGRAQLLKKLKAGLHSLGHVFSLIGKFFGKLSKVNKAIFVVLVLGIGFTGGFVYLSLTKGVIHTPSSPYLGSLEEVASEIYEYDPETENEAFYDNLRASDNLLLMPRILVNLKRTPKSGNNPMLALEIFVEGVVPEVIVEVKDREAAFRDLIQREVEDWTFELLDTPQGKKDLLEKLKKEINGALTTGSVRRVLIKTIVLKP